MQKQIASAAHYGKCGNLSKYWTDQLSAADAPSARMTNLNASQPAFNYKSPITNSHSESARARVAPTILALEIQN
jgi:hypothetical protein